MAAIDMASSVRVLSQRLVIEPFTPPLYDDYDIHDKTLALVRPTGDAHGRGITLRLQATDDSTGSDSAGYAWRRHWDGVTCILRRNSLPKCDESLKPQANAISVIER